MVVIDTFLYRRFVPRPYFFIARTCHRKWSPSYMAKLSRPIRAKSAPVTLQRTRQRTEWSIPCHKRRPETAKPIRPKYAPCVLEPKVYPATRCKLEQLARFSPWRMAEKFVPDAGDIALQPKKNCQRCVMSIRQAEAGRTSSLQKGEKTVSENFTAYLPNQDKTGPPDTTLPSRGDGNSRPDKKGSEITEEDELDWRVSKRSSHPLPPSWVERLAKPKQSCSKFHSLSKATASKRGKNEYFKLNQLS